MVLIRRNGSIKFRELLFSDLDLTNLFSIQHYLFDTPNNRFIYDVNDKLDYL